MAYVLNARLDPPRADGGVYQALVRTAYKWIVTITGTPSSPSLEVVELASVTPEVVNSGASRLTLASAVLGGSGNQLDAVPQLAVGTVPFRIRVTRDAESASITRRVKFVVSY